MSSDYRLHVTSRPSLEVMKELNSRPLRSREDTVDYDLSPIEVEQLLSGESLPLPILNKMLKRRFEAFSKEHVKTKPLTEEEKAQDEKDKREMFIFKIVFFAMLLFVALCILIAYLK